jgi:hypothetical protein
VWLFSRMTRAYTKGIDAVTDAVRTALIFGLCLWLPALIFTTDNEELGRGWGSDLDAGSLGVEAQVGANAGGALVLGFLILLTVLALSVLMRADWWHASEQPTPARAAFLRAREWVAAPLAGLTTLVVLLPVAGAIGLLAVLLFVESNELNMNGDETRLTIAACAALLANGGVWVLSIGSGSRFGSHTETEGGASQDQWERLWGQITTDEPGLWISPVVLLAVLTIAAMVVVRKSSGEAALRSLAVGVGSLLVAIPLLVRLTAIHLSGRAAVEGESLDGSVYVGPDGLQTTLLIVLLAAVVAFVVAMIRGVLDPAKVKATLSHAARSIQRPDSTSSAS